MAVLHLWQSKNDCGVNRKQGEDDGLSGGRRGIRGKNPAALYREYRGHRPDLPGDVQEQLLPRLVAFGVVGPHPARTGDGTSQYRQDDAGCDPKRRAGDRAALVEENETSEGKWGRDFVLLNNSICG